MHGYKTNSLLIYLLLLAVSSWADTYNKDEIDSLNSLEREHIFENINTSVSLYSLLADECAAKGYAEGEAAAAQNLAVAAYMNGQYDESVDAHLRSIRLFDSLQDQHGLASAYGELGYQMKRRDLVRAKRYMQQGIHIARSVGDSTQLGSLFNNYGVLQEMSADLDSARFYYHLALNLAVSQEDSTAVPYSLNNLAIVYAAMGNVQESMRHLHMSDYYRRREEGNYGLIENSVLWADLYYMEGQQDSALQRYSWAVSIPEAYQHQARASHCFNQIALIYEDRQDFQAAYNNHKTFAAFRDSLFSLETASTIAALEIEYESEKKDRQLAESKLQIALRNRQVGLLAAAIILMMFLVASASWYLKLKSRLRQARAEQRMSDEKLRISRELHDNIGSQLTFMISSLDNMGYRTAKESSVQTMRGKLSELSGFGRSTLNELRNTVWAMRQEDMSLHDFLLKLNELRSQLGQHKSAPALDIQSDLDVDLHMKSSRMLTLLRISQEAIQNALKHAEASCITVRLSMDGDCLLLEVKDNGKGFDPAMYSAGSGMSSMQTRCEGSSGQFTVNSSGSGTQVLCRFQPE